MLVNQSESLFWSFLDLSGGREHENLDCRKLLEQLSNSGDNWIAFYNFLARGG
jgi:hypothetical protein